MAQPLTVLRGALEAWKMRGAVEAEKGRYLQMAANQVDRMSDLLSSLRDVLDVADGVPNRLNVDVWELIGLVLEDMNCVLGEWGGTIERVEPDCHVLIQGDANRTERALRAAFRLVVSLSAPGGVIRVSIRRAEGKVEVLLEGTTSHRDTLSFTDQLNLSLIETNIRSQEGSCECVKDPPSILIALPAHGSEAADPLFQFACKQEGLST
jgi:signal transduction histidine kinase